MPTLTFHEDRAKTVLIPMIRAYREFTHLYARHHAELQTAPQNNIPKGMKPKTPSHIRWLFMTTLVTLQSDSDEGFAQAAQMYERYPDCFSKEALVLANSFDQAQADLPFMETGKRRSVLEQRIKEIGFNKPTQWTRYWRDTIQTLFDEYGGEPLRIIQEEKDVDGFIVRKRREKRRGNLWWFTGYGEKLFSLFCIYCEELDLIDPVWDAFPVDVHVQRICISTGIVSCDVDTFQDQILARFLRKKLVSFCVEHNVDRGLLAHAFWFGGSKGCRYCFRTPGIEHHCAVERFCKGSPPTEPYWKRGKWELWRPWNSKGAAGGMF